MDHTSPRDELIAFARALRRERRARDLSQEQLAVRAGLSPQHISSIERANKDARITTVVRLADALGIEVSRLFGEVEEPHVEPSPTARQTSSTRTAPHRIRGWR